MPNWSMAKYSPTPRKLKSSIKLSDQAFSMFSKKTLIWRGCWLDYDNPL